MEYSLYRISPAGDHILIGSGTGRDLFQVTPNFISAIHSDMGAGDVTYPDFDPEHSTETIRVYHMTGGTNHYVVLEACV